MSINQYNDKYNSLCGQQTSNNYPYDKLRNVYGQGAYNRDWGKATEQYATSSTMPLSHSQSEVEYTFKKINELAALNALKNTKENQKSMFSEFKSFIAKHSDIIFTALLVLLVDEFFLRGALKDKVTAILHKTLDKYTAKTDTPEV